MTAPPEARDKSRRKIPGWLWIAIAVVAAFLIGLGLQYFRAEQLQDELVETRQALTLARLEAALATAIVEAQQGNYELARQRASEFFRGLQQWATRLGGGAPAEFERVLAQRDVAITFLSRASPESAAALQRLYAEYRAGLRRVVAAEAG